MSQDHERLVQEAVRAFNERDIEGIVATVHPEAEIELIGGFAGVMGTRFQGPEGVRRFYTD
ncbi:MAG TPA: nuclear transport factor 2 family protein [Solirubrobacterales bacterium]|jgi:hypothetical protein|nr:nuclear transport factor 2 family protein [Solirubrobacterales bacterium]